MFHFEGLGFDILTVLSHEEAAVLGRGVATVSTLPSCFATRVRHNLQIRGK